MLAEPAEPPIQRSGVLSHRSELPDGVRATESRRQTTPETELLEPQRSLQQRDPSCGFPRTCATSERAASGCAPCTWRPLPATTGIQASTVPRGCVAPPSQD